MGAGCQLMEALQPAVHKAAAALSAQLAMSFFMPLCLTAFANLARVRVNNPRPNASPLMMQAYYGICTQGTSFVNACIG